MTPIRVVIAGGGTGGHLYPGIAVARELRRRRPAAVVTFAGTAKGIEARVIPREGFELDLLRSAGLKGMGAGGLIRGLSLLPLSSPLIMPGRIAVGSPSAIELVVSLALLVASLFAVVWLAGRIYAAAMLMNLYDLLRD